MSKLSNNISLSELIAKVKEQLKNRNKDSPFFLLEKAELELQVIFSKEIYGEVERKLNQNLKSLRRIIRLSSQCRSAPYSSTLLSIIYQGECPISTKYF
ncbi:trypco2 family protein [Calothrix sp. CCY 0018]|uniref:trypco2 family protein n=1 Tax=Calothrix sp. CCY 0018 TaxID=3103864 RepID=UPI0039C75CE0